MGSSPPPPPQCPCGWFCVAYSDELQVGEAKPLRYFGKDLVLFRTESGKAVVLDAYCPHLSAHLGHGIHEEIGIGRRIEGETIVCPFHAWHFNGNGECVEAPYVTQVPPRCRARDLPPFPYAVRQRGPDCEVPQVVKPVLYGL